MENRLPRHRRSALFPSLLSAHLLLIQVSISSAQTVSFGSATSFGVGTGPQSVAVGDFNGNGKLDLAVTNITGGNVSILLGTGAGSFTSAFGSPIAVETSPDSVTVGDFNRDGIQDLAVANGGFASNNVSVLLGTGTGSFLAATGSPFAVGTTPESVAVGYFNEDAVPDLAVASFNSNNISILLGTGTGSFSPAMNVPVGTGSSSVAIGDFNRDARQDLAVTNQSNGNVVVMLGTATGCCTQVAGSPFSVGTGPNSVAAGDFNEDGKLDLAAANQFSNNVSILLGNGDGTFAAAANLTAENQPFSVAVGDLNGDGTLDLAVVNLNDNNVSVLLGTGTGSFGTATNFAVGSSPRFVAIADFDRDGKPDLAVTNFGNNNVSILLNTTSFVPAGSFGTATNFAVGSNPHSVAVGDLNWDGKLDLGTANGGFDVSILLGTGTGSFGTATNLPLGGYVQPRSLAIGDLNRDGRLDLVTANSNYHNVSVFFGTGTGSFGAATNVAVGIQPFSVAIGDFSRDGNLDLAVANVGLDISSGSVSILLGSGTGSFTPAAGSPFAAGAGPSSVAVGDFNRDGIQDLAVANYSSDNISILLGTGGFFGFGAATNFAAGGTGPFSVVISDFNGDGVLDLAVANLGFASNNVSILLGTGTGSLGAATNFPGGPDPYSVTAGDFNRDGEVDLAVANSLFSNVSVLLGTGTGSFGAATDFAVASGTEALAVGDFNRDGKQDLAVANLTGNNVSVLLNTAPALTVTKAGTGSGTVTSSPPGIVCSGLGPECTMAYNAGASVTLTATAAANSFFAGWSGAGCSGAETCIFTITADTIVTAIFAATAFTFTDDPLTAQVTLVKAVHITELRQAIDTLRSRTGLTAFIYTDPTLTVGATQIRAVYITDLRTALDEVYDALSKARPSYTDTTILAGQTIVKKAHIAEIRSAIRPVE